MTPPLWQVDKRRADRFLPEIKGILGKYLIGAAPIVEDMERNTDLIVLRLEAVRIGCRVRSHKYYTSKYRDQFTLRSGRPSGVRTELSKVIQGWGDYFFYGFSDATEDGLHAWVIGDLDEFRLWYNRELYLGSHPGELCMNGDGSSGFMAFNIYDLPPTFVLARYRADELSR